MVSAFCALTMGAHAMDPIADAPQPNLAETLKACVDFKDLWFEVGAFLYKGKLHRKGFLKCFNKAKISELFSGTPEKFESLVDTTHVVEFFRLVLEKSYDDESRTKKARALKNSFHMDAWEDELECENLGPVLTNLTQVIYFSGTDAEKKTLLGKLKRSIARIAPEDGAQERKIDTFFDLPALARIVDDLLADQAVSEEHIVRVIKADTLLENISGHTKTVCSYIHLRNFLTFMVTLIRADQAQKDPSFSALLNCLRWDAFFINLPELLGHSPAILPSLFSIPELKAQITLLQEGTELTAEGLRTIINTQALQSFRITPEMVEEYVNFELLARGLNALRRGEQSEELKQAFNIPSLEALLGKDISSAINSDLPEAAQYKRLSELRDYLTKSTWLLPLFTCGTGILWLGTMVLCEGKWYSAVPLAIGVAAYNGLTYGQKKKPLSIPIGNWIAVKAHRFFAKLLPLKETLKNELLELAPTHPEHEQNYRLIVSLLTEEHLQTLPHSLQLLNLFEKPRTFVAKHPKFINSICTLDNENALACLTIIRDLLEQVVPLENLPHKKAIETFFDLCNPETLIELPHTGLIMIVLYCPHVLERQQEFLQKAETLVTDNNRPITWYYHEALKQAQDIRDIDLEQ